MRRGDSGNNSRTGPDSHTHTHTHTHTLSLLQELTHTHTRAHTHTLSLSLSHAQGADVPIVETTQEPDLVPLLRQALKLN